MNVLYSSFIVTLNTLHDKIGTVALELQKEAAKQNLLITGPVHWFYFGANGNPDTLFTLLIAIPISRLPVTRDNILYAEFPAFRCLSATHSGSWSELAGTYKKMSDKINSDGLATYGVTREAYTNIDFARPGNNLTEIQIGIN